VTFDPVARLPASELVFRQLRRAVLTGELSAGERLPAERELAASFAVNRHVVREALKRLQQSGLVSIAQGGASRVLDARVHGGLDLLPQLAEVAAESAHQGSPALALEVLRSGLEMRRAVGAEVARAAAERAAPAVRELLPGLAADYAGEDPVTADEAFWQVLVDAADNIAYRLALNTLMVVIAEHRALVDVLLADERADVVGHQRLAEAIVTGAAEEAFVRARALLTGPEVAGPDAVRATVLTEEVR